MVFQFVYFSLAASPGLQSPGNRIAQAPPCWWKVHGNHQSELVAFSNQQQICLHSPQGLRVRGYFNIDVQLRIPGIRNIQPAETSREQVSHKLCL